MAAYWMGIALAALLWALAGLLAVAGRRARRRYLLRRIADSRVYVR